MSTHADFFPQSAEQCEPLRRSERYGPDRRRVLARCRCTAGTRLWCCARPGGLLAWRWRRCAWLTHPPPS